MADRMALLGSLVNDTNGGTAQHVVRIMHSDRAFISNNTFGNPALTKQTFTLRGASYIPANNPHILPGTAAYTTKTVISDNKFIAGISNQPVMINPSNSTEDTVFQDIILERNWYTGAGANCCVPMLGLQAQDTTVRNEIIDMTGAGNGHMGIAIGAAGGGVSPTSNNVRLYNNTVFSNDSGDFRALRVQLLTTNITAINNLAYSPNVSGSFIDPGWGTPTTASNNTTNTQTSPLLSATPPTTPIQFQPTCTGSIYPCGQGTLVPVWSDFSLVPPTSTRDIGAITH